MDHFDNGQRGALKVGGVLALQRGAIGRFNNSVMWENGSSWKLTLGSLESIILPNSLGLFNNFNNGRWIIVTIGNDVLSVGGRWQGGREGGNILRRLHLDTRPSNSVWEAPFLRGNIQPALLRVVFYHLTTVSIPTLHHFEKITKIRFT